MKKLLWIFLGSFIFYLPNIFAFPTYGVFYSHSVIDRVPENLHGYRLGLWYQSQNLIWPRWNILFDGSVGHWWMTGNESHRNLNILSFSPIFRVYFMKTTTISPFLHLGIGLAYLSKTYIGRRNLGMHFSFQDQAGIGATFGKNRQFSLLFSALHYSNGSISSKNSGITVPLMINGEYGFG